MSFNLVPPMLTDAALLGSAESNWVTMDIQVFDPAADCTGFTTLQEPPILPQNLAFRPLSTSVPITAPQTALDRPRVPRPESQGDWNAKKDVIRRLYLDENLPLKDIIDVMSKEHSFSATERMYKRQFQKWNWKKYNTKALQRSRAEGIAVETCRGVATCRRPAKRHLNHVFIQNSEIFFGPDGIDFG
ncbi:hypothetical protein LZ32DRAFT_662930 [Colletotrichum eremochloae]|nr:hypothetical protein LZ32DRAFT_662930 [Colletotrichum eremochloae]